MKASITSVESTLREYIKSHTPWCLVFQMSFLFLELKKKQNSNVAMPRKALFITLTIIA